MEYALQKTSSGQMILEYLFFFGTVSKANIALAFSSLREYSSIMSGIDRLVHLGYVKYADNDRKYLSLTPEGIIHLGHHDKYFQDSYKNDEHQSLGEARKSSNVNNIYAVIFSTGILMYEKEKPSLEEMFSYWGFKTTEENNPQNEIKKNNRLTEFVGRGIYYTKKELMGTWKKRGEDIEVFFGTKLQGIIITPYGLFTVYYSPTVVIGWSQYVENITKRKIMEYFPKLPRQPVCIYFGKSYSLFSTIATGYVYGRMKTEHSLAVAAEEKMKTMDEKEAREFALSEKRRQAKSEDIAQKKRDHSPYFSADRKYFLSVYSLPLKKGSTEMLGKIIFGNTSSEANEAREWFESHEGFRENSAAGEFRGIDERTGSPAVYVGTPECCRIRTLRQALMKKGDGYRITLVTYPELAADLLKVIGSRAGDVYDLDGNMIEIEHCDDFGFKESEKQDTLKKINAPKKEKKKRITIAGMVDEETNIKIRKIAVENKMSLSTTVGMLLRAGLGMYQ